MDEENQAQSKITMVEKQKKNPSRYNIYVNEEFAFGVHEDILVKYRLVKGREIETEEMKEILEQEEQNRAQQYALRYLGQRPRTEAEVTNYLLNKGFELSVCQQAVAYCVERGYINDQQYAKQWIEERKRLRPRGRFLLRQELLHRGIDEEEVHQVLNYQLSHGDEQEMVEILIRKKCKGKKYENSYELKKKIIPYLQRKGFSLESIMPVLEKVKQEYIMGPEI